MNAKGWEIARASARRINAEKAAQYERRLRQDSLRIYRAGCALLFAMLAGTYLTGCSEPMHDVAYYLERDAERHATLAECRNNVALAQVSPNCMNAQEAQHRKLFSGTDMPRIR